MTKILAIVLAVSCGVVFRAYAGGKMQLNMNSEGKSSQTMRFEQAQALSSKAKTDTKKPKTVTSKQYFSETADYTNPATDPGIACPSKSQGNAEIKAGDFNNAVNLLTNYIANNQCHDYFNNNHQYFIAGVPYAVTTKNRVKVTIGCDNASQFVSQVNVDKVYCIYTPQ